MSADEAILEASHIAAVSQQDGGVSSLAAEDPSTRKKMSHTPGLVGMQFDLGGLLGCRVGVRTPTLSATLKQFLGRITYLEEEQDKLLKSGVSFNPTEAAVHDAMTL